MFVLVVVDADVLSFVKCTKWPGFVIVRYFTKRRCRRSKIQMIYMFDTFSVHSHKNTTVKMSKFTRIYTDSSCVWKHIFMCVYGCFFLCVFWYPLPNIHTLDAQKSLYCIYKSLKTFTHRYIFNPIFFPLDTRYNGIHKNRSLYKITISYGHDSLVCERSRLSTN